MPDRACGVQAEGRPARLEGREQAGTWREGAQLHLTKTPKAVERTMSQDPCPCGSGGVGAEVSRSSRNWDVEQTQFPAWSPTNLDTDQWWGGGNPGGGCVCISEEM